MKQIQIYSSVWPASSDPVDEELTKVWDDDSMSNPWDFEVWARFLQWNDTDNHKNGFKILGQLEITNYIEISKLQNILLETENIRKGKFGVLKSSGFSQKLIEETESIKNTGSSSTYLKEIGMLMKKILTMDDGDNLYKYYVDGAWQTVHCWELVVKIGDKSRNAWLSPPFNWIYGWRFDPDNEDYPRWDGMMRNSPQDFIVSGKSLLAWAKTRSSKYFGDYKNPALVWGSRASNEELNFLTTVGNYTLMPFLEDLIHYLGIQDTYIEEMSISCDVSTSAQHSTINYEDTDDIDTDGLGQIPEPFFWKTVVNDSGENVHYTVWVSYTNEDSPRVKIDAWNETTGKIIQETVYLENLITMTQRTARVRRLWYQGSGSTFYMLAEHSTNWFIWSVTLSGTIGNVKDNSSGTEYDIDAMTGSWKRHWMQCDLDQDNSRLYGAITYFSTPTSYYALGYWDWGTGNWNTIYDSTTRGISWVVQEGSNAGDEITGFRCVKNPGGASGICAMISQRNTSPTVHVLLKFLIFDTSLDNEEENAQVVTYDYATAGEGVLYNSDMGYPVLNGRGSVGGFFDASKFYFVLPSVVWRYGSMLGRWVEWTAGTAYDTYALTQVGGLQARYRTFNSHGSYNLDFCTGFIGKLSSTEAEEDHSKMHYHETYFHLLAGSKANIYEVVGWNASDENDFEILSAPSTSYYKLGPASGPKYRPFIFWKKFTDSTDTLQRRSFLTIYSEHWIPNFSHDLYSNGGSIADELQDIAWAYGLKMKLGLWKTVVKKRFEGLVTESVDTLDKGFYKFNKISTKIVAGYDRVELTDASGATHSSGSEFSDNIFSISSNYVLNSRASKRTSELYDLLNKNKYTYTLKGICKPQLEPMDIVKAHIIIPIGNQGYTDGVTKEEIFGPIQRITVNNGDTDIEILALNDSPNDFV